MNRDGRRNTLLLVDGTQQYSPLHFPLTWPSCALVEEMVYKKVKPYLMAESIYAKLTFSNDYFMRPFFVVPTFSLGTSPNDDTLGVLSNKQARKY